jgi:xylulokinase
MRDAGVNSDKIILFGGGAKSRIWKQITADIFDTKIVTLNVEEGPSYGGALLAGVGCGIYKSVLEATSKVIKEVDSVMPISENAVKYKKQYGIYKSLYNDLKKDFENLSKI